MAIYTKISLVIILVKLADDQDAVDVTIKHHIPEIPFKSTIITVAAFIGLTIYYSSEAITKISLGKTLPQLLSSLTEDLPNMGWKILLKH